MKTDCNSVSQTEVTKYLVVLDTENPEYAEKNKAASETDMTKEFTWLTKTNLLTWECWRERRRSGEKRSSIDTVVKTHRHCWVKTKEKCSLLGCHKDFSQLDSMLASGQWGIPDQLLCKDQIYYFLGHSAGWKMGGTVVRKSSGHSLVYSTFDIYIASF